MFSPAAAACKKGARRKRKGPTERPSLSNDVRVVKVVETRRGLLVVDGFLPLGESALDRLEGVQPHVQGHESDAHSPLAQLLE